MQTMAKSSLEVELALLSDPHAIKVISWDAASCSRETTSIAVTATTIQMLAVEVVEEAMRGILCDLHRQPEEVLGSSISEAAMVEEAKTFHISITVQIQQMTRIGGATETTCHTESKYTYTSPETAMS